ncbi:hypothetical protein B9Z55_026326 [Caenorhabditis nigoni]|uniref:Uncharacterized protein n=1 Tax=Caenorhabditis nigoni TaxID=1611254 RepID=A0A2G5T2M0_9PELO|nr:hypothetical protein B9Z55_026326 [Caenorhabditis nigoni]
MSNFRSIRVSLTFRVFIEIQPLVEGTEAYEKLLQEARDHHAACFCAKFQNILLLDPHVNTLRGLVRAMLLAGQDTNLLVPNLAQLQDWMLPQAHREVVEVATQTVSEMDNNVLLDNAFIRAFVAVQEINNNQYRDPLHQQRLRGQVLLAACVLMQQVAHAEIGSGQYGAHINSLHTACLLVQHAGEGLNLQAPVLPQLMAPVLPQLPAAAEVVDATTQTVSDLAMDTLEIDEQVAPSEAQLTSTEPVPQTEVVINAPVNAAAVDSKTKMAKLNN